MIMEAIKAMIHDQCLLMHLWEEDVITLVIYNEVVEEIDMMVTTKPLWKIWDLALITNKRRPYWASERDLIFYNGFRFV
jgi:hypothetical protein